MFKWHLCVKYERGNLYVGASCRSSICYCGPSSWGPVTNLGARPRLAPPAGLEQVAKNVGPVASQDQPELDEEDQEGCFR